MLLKSVNQCKSTGIKIYCTVFNTQIDTWTPFKVLFTIINSPEFSESWINGSILYYNTLMLGNKR